jgi:F-type H+-transporting ATPase subunit delta
LRENIIAKRYARALLEIAQERDQLEQVREELRTFVASYQAVPELQTYWENPLVDTEQKTRLLETALERSGVSSALLQFLDLVARRRRFPLLVPIAGQFEELYDRMMGRLKAEGKTAVGLDDQRRLALEEALSGFTGKSVSLRLEVDPAVLGGITVKIGDQVLDGSLKTRLGLLQATE